MGYVRGRYCCTCGFGGAETESCTSAYQPVAAQVNVTTGPYANLNELQDGKCGSSCEGTAADNGVIEFDTVTSEIIATHNIKDGTGWGADPVSSPDGKYVVFMPNDGGQNVRLITPGANGEPSSLAADIPMDFVGGVAGKTVVSDIAFIQDERRNIMVVGASTDNDLVFVDLDDPSYPTFKLTLTTQEESSSSSRKVEWAVGSDYVWVRGDQALEMYIVEVPGAYNSAKLHQTMAETTSTNMIYVNNYERVRAEQGALEMMMSVKQDFLDSVPEPEFPEPEKATSDSSMMDHSHSHDSHDSHDAETNTIRAANNEATDDDGEDKIDAVSIAGLIIGSVALVTSSILMIYTLSQKSNDATTDVAGDKSLSSNLKVN